ncbi:hypothetical protein NL108_011550 [Boleophthalmus pectinirostris]|nr:hypothetical protein NL108_011550 [Boleophthalmus pectinirostris]
MIAKEMSERGYKRSWLQCQRKIMSVRAKNKEDKDSNKRSGRGCLTCPFYQELDRILGDNLCVLQCACETLLGSLMFTLEITYKSSLIGNVNDLAKKIIFHKKICSLRLCLH